MKQAIFDACRKLDPRHQIKNPVMFVVWVGSILTTLLFLQAVVGSGEAPAGFILSIALWLWFTVLFANFAEAMAEGRGKAQADSLRRARQELTAKKLGAVEPGSEHHAVWNRKLNQLETFSVVAANELKKGDMVLVEANEYIPADGEVVEGVASVNESAITGESAPVIRESGGDRSAVTGGTKVLSDWLVICVTATSGESFLDRMIAMVEGAKRQKTPNEIALNILLAALTIIFLLATVTLLPFSLYSVAAAGQGTPITVTVLSLFWFVLFRRPLARCFPRLALQAWTEWCKPMSLPCLGKLLRRQAMWMCCCWTRPARLHWATARRRCFFRPKV